MRPRGCDVGRVLFPASISFSQEGIFSPNKGRQGTCQEMTAVCQQGLAQNAPQVPQMSTRDGMSRIVTADTASCSWLVRLMSHPLQPW